MDTDDANANSNAVAENNDIMIKLISAEDDSTGESQVFEISLAAAGLSVLVVDAAGDVEDDDDDDDDDDDNARNKPPLEINISRVKGPCLAKVVDFMNHHHTDKMKAIPTPLGGSSFNEVMDQEWYQHFISDENLGGNDMLFDLLTSANFMGIKELLDLCCLKVTFQLTGKSADEIREILRLPELSPEEEAQAREEHKWIFEDS
ncbi:E3 ubiquitin ligase SCF complex, Skp subunit [Fragilariopsis cylindrus CCMP1102]|uniref:E3 ubiquitin ligase SCF complex, Skp subunit n=1 Tax=Fragilariopsis cylindrus CCMP1102 TaxID=635003 RepID=A0A1E7EWY2_9STRA|nr:E3 ubiquitin ligase SCF complex, Skp subunit [Fragilariopsis cylindrus CCMP1102]|eukprot:OEU10550.1 E3 ubiquitin ligase SCF complex, Skp subunit [Fragilariopsis cylindrus CCMP1102]